MASLVLKRLRESEEDYTNVIRKELKTEVKNDTDYTDELINLDVDVEEAPEFKPIKIDWPKFKMYEGEDIVGINFSDADRFGSYGKNDALNYFKVLEPYGETRENKIPRSRGMVDTLEDLDSKVGGYGNITGYTAPAYLNFGMQGKSWDDIEKKKQEVIEETEGLAGDALTKQFYDALRAERLARTERTVPGSQTFQKQGLLNVVGNSDLSAGQVRDIGGRVSKAVGRNGFKIEPVLEEFKETSKITKGGQTIAKAWKQSKDRRVMQQQQRQENEMMGVNDFEGQVERLTRRNTRNNASKTIEKALTKFTGQVRQQKENQLMGANDTKIAEKVAKIVKEDFANNEGLKEMLIDSGVFSGKPYDDEDEKEAELEQLLADAGVFGNETSRTQKGVEKLIKLLNNKQLASSFRKLKDKGPVSVSVPGAEPDDVDKLLADLSKQKPIKSPAKPPSFLSQIHALKKATPPSTPKKQPTPQATPQATPKKPTGQAPNLLSQIQGAVLKKAPTPHTTPTSTPIKASSLLSQLQGVKLKKESEQKPLSAKEPTPPKPENALLKKAISARRSVTKRDSDTESDTGWVSSDGGSNVRKISRKATDPTNRLFQARQRSEEEKKADEEAEKLVDALADVSNANSAKKRALAVARARELAEATLKSQTVLQSIPIADYSSLSGSSSGSSDSESDQESKKRLNAALNALKKITPIKKQPHIEVDLNDPLLPHAVDVGTKAPETAPATISKQDKHDELRRAEGRLQLFMQQGQKGDPVKHLLKKLNEDYGFKFGTTISKPDTALTQIQSVLHQINQSLEEEKKAKAGPKKAQGFDAFPAQVAGIMRALNNDRIAKLKMKDDTIDRYNETLKKAGRKITLHHGSTGEEIANMIKFDYGVF